MAKKAKTQPGADGAEAEKKPATVKLATVVLCLGLAAGGYVLGGRSGGATPAEAAPETTLPTRDDGCVVEEPVDEHASPTVVDLPAMSINLADGHYLRIAVSLGLCPGVELAAEDSGGHGGESHGIAFASAPAQDIVVESLSGSSIEELSTEAGRRTAKEHLTEQIREVYPSVVADLYFIEFVMQ